MIPKTYPKTINHKQIIKQSKLGKKESPKRLTESIFEKNVATERNKGVKAFGGITNDYKMKEKREDFEIAEADESIKELGISLNISSLESETKERKLPVMKNDKFVKKSKSIINNTIKKENPIKLNVLPKNKSKVNLNANDSNVNKDKEIPGTKKNIFNFNKDKSHINLNKKSPKIVSNKSMPIKGMIGGFANKKNTDEENNDDSENDLSLNVEKNHKKTTNSIVDRIFNPDIQRRIEKLKSKSHENANAVHRVEKEKNPVKGRMMFKKLEETPVLGQRFVKPIYEKVFSGSDMATVGLHSHLVKTVKDLLNISELTLVQQRAIPNILDGRDALIRSQTGSGKTLAYALPIVHKLQEIRPKLTRNSGIQALIVVPTRELAIQSYELLIKILKPYTWIVPGYLSGGEKRKSEKARLRKGINILVGTPGRLVDHLLHTSSLSLNKVQFLVLDEADRLFELGYEKDVSKIVDALKGIQVKSDIPNSYTKSNKQDVINEDNNHITRFDAVEIDESNKIELIPLPVQETTLTKVQSILLSATLTSAVNKLAGLTLENPLFIDTADIDDSDKAIPSSFDDEASALVIPSTITISYILVPPKLRLVLLSSLLARESISKQNKILVFVATQDLVDFHHDLMVECLTRKVLDDDDEDKDDEDDDDETDGILVGVRFFKLHGSLSQVERNAVFREFVNAKSGVLLTTVSAFLKNNTSVKFSIPRIYSADYLDKIL